MVSGVDRDGGHDIAYLDLVTGEVRMTGDGDDSEDFHADENLLLLPEDPYGELDWGMIEGFANSLESGAPRGRLSRPSGAREFSGVSSKSRSKAAMWN